MPLKECVEVLSIAFWDEKDFEFVVSSTEGVFHCSSRTSMPYGLESGYKDPVCLTYKSHKGIPTSVCCLPKSDLFASGGTDQEIRIYQAKMVWNRNIVQEH